MYSPRKAGAAKSVSDFVRWSAANPAKIGGLYPRKGAIQPGSDADIAIVDLACERTIDDAKLQSRSKATPFHGMKPRGFRSTRSCAAAL